MGGFTQAALPLIMTGAGAAARHAKANAARRAENARADRLTAIENRRQAAAERTRKQELKRTLAAQRAKFGAGGLGGAGGSAEAVLRGLERDAAHDLSDARFESDLRRQDINARRKRNLLETSGAFNRIAFGGWEKTLPKKRSLLG